ncbi:MAG: hypothetical protein ACP6IY_18320, partial [Promethearchaeia archaeon]
DKIELIFQIIQFKDLLKLVDLNIDAWRIFHNLKIPELHDRMIVALYKYFNAKAIITNNPEMEEQANIVWD